MPRERVDSHHDNYVPEEEDIDTLVTQAPKSNVHLGLERGVILFGTEAPAQTSSSYKQSALKSTPATQELSKTSDAKSEVPRIEVDPPKTHNNLQSEVDYMREALELLQTPSSPTPSELDESSEASSFESVPSPSSPRKIIKEYLLEWVKTRVYQILRGQGPRVNDEACDTGESSSNTASHTRQNSESSNSQPRNVKRRSSGEDRSDESDHGAEAPKRLKKERDLRSVASSPELLFACHFCKRRPRLYSGVRWKNCLGPGPGWMEVHRVKQHLLSCHKLKPKCPRCGKEFKSQTHVDLHLQEFLACLKEDVPRTEGISIEMEYRIKDRTGLSKMTAHEKWLHWYRILFPNDDPLMIPSPYHEDVSLDFNLHDDYLRFEFINDVEAELELNLSEQLTSLAPQLREILRTTLRNVHRRRLSGRTELAGNADVTNAQNFEDAEWAAFFDLPVDLPLDTPTHGLLGLIDPEDANFPSSILAFPTDSDLIASNANDIDFANLIAQAPSFTETTGLEETIGRGLVSDSHGKRRERVDSVWQPDDQK